MMLTAVNYPSKYNFKDNLLEYRDLKEMSQGGPEIGKLFLNNEMILKDEYFSGPLIFQENLNKVIVPVLYRSFFFTKFKIAIIDLSTKECVVLNKKEDLILLKSVSRERIISYYNDINNKNLKTLKF
ncbi:hypothetical protein JM83_2919 [Gillisia sp. Hel_I_86]|uniref:hypothetical protein n=1 Tax=Gillisia sp. Hel_I_86 TaxID=1249981 RepID=UPI001199946F|nr:hypothetical protein [Gillisia sp. Hel_I_86]TVZ27853.1 hypothetical protein JM83_2919 [Gillisia sp. Hel_I_86]